MILVVGDASVDLTARVARVPDDDEKLYAESSSMAAGGVALNTAVVLSRMGSSAGLAADIGSDPFGDLVESTLDDEGVDRSNVVRRPGARTYGTFSMLVGESAEKRMVIMPADSHYPSDLSHIALEGIEWCHTWPFDYDVAVELASSCRQGGIPFSIDLEPATLPKQVDLVEALTSGAEAVIVNGESSRAFSESPGDAVEALVDHYGAQTAIATLGENGAMYTGIGQATQVVEAYQVDAVDTTGAGDAFAAGYVHCRSQGTAVSDSVRFAVAAGAIACTGLGPRGAVVDVAAVRRLQNESKEGRR